jgi:hypothetical protein
MQIQDGHQCSRVEVHHSSSIDAATSESSGGGEPIAAFASFQCLSDCAGAKATGSLITPVSRGITATLHLPGRKLERFKEELVTSIVVQVVK